jgi:hypothetical protein
MKQNYLINLVQLYYQKWWIPFFFIGAATFISIFFILRTQVDVVYILLISLISFLGGITVSINHFFHSRYFTGFLHILLILFSTAASFVLIILTAIYLEGGGDTFADDKTIPSDVSFSVPLDSLPTEDDFLEYDLVLQNSYQPGMYIYYTDFKPSVSGYFFIRAFEITENIPLSPKSIFERSLLIYDFQQPILFNKSFTIFEGNWGQKYGSRIELWYQPSSGFPKCLVEERVYIVEGWMR